MTDNKITYSDAIEKVMLSNGYFAPLKLIYKEIHKYKNFENIKGKTPHLTIQERVQRDSRFTRIGLGVYALTQYLDYMPDEFIPRTKEEQKISLHSNIQGMLLELGNFKTEVDNTYTFDKNRVFKGKSLGSLATLKEPPEFTYTNIIRDSVRFVDVIWFNKRGFPTKIFEVEHSTDFRDAFVKFLELQDFMVEFYCVSAENRKNKFDKEINKVAFNSILNRVKFINYEQIENDYNNTLLNNYL